jgi:ParB family transcriptional regulator, chromosome partitioning protein
MAGKGRVSKERLTLEEQSRKALAGLGITGEAAIQGVLAETLRMPPTPPPAVMPLSPLMVNVEEVTRESLAFTNPPVEVSSSAPPAPAVSQPTEGEAERVYNLAVDLLDPSPDQPRLDVEPDPEFLENIRVKGVRTPIHVRPSENGRYHIVAGERRWRACQLLGKPTIPALIRQDSLDVAAAEALVDNLLRKDLTGYEEAKGFKKLVEQHRYQKAELAQRLGCDKTRITRALQVLELPEHILELTLGPGSPLSLTHVQELLPLRSNLIRLERVARQAMAEGWTARRIREEVTRVPRTNQGAQSVRFSAPRDNGPFTLTIRFHPNRAHEIEQIEEAIRTAQARLDRFKAQSSTR